VSSIIKLLLYLDDTNLKKVPAVKHCHIP